MPVLILFANIIYGLSVDLSVVKTNNNILYTNFAEGFYISMVASVLLVVLNNFVRIKLKYFKSSFEIG
jgi:hypothetical protein